MKARCISGTQPQNIKQLEHFLKTKISSVPMQKMEVLYEIVNVWRDVKNPNRKTLQEICADFCKANFRCERENCMAPKMPAGMFQ